MGRQYSIWHQINAYHYKSDKSYGSKTDSGETIYVGTSSNNSHKHCEILTTKRTKLDSKFGEIFIFKTSIDGVVLKETWISVKDKEVVKVKTKLNKIKSL